MITMYSQSTSADTPVPEDWTVVDETMNADAFDVREVVSTGTIRGRFALNPPTSLISTQEMSFTFISENGVDAEQEDRHDGRGEDVVINNTQFQLESMQDTVNDLKKSNEELLSENSDLRVTNQTLLVQIDRLNAQIDELVTKKVHQNHKIAQLKLRVGGQGRVINKMQKGLFQHSTQFIGRGTFLNGEEVFWRKASQCSWDEELHGPIFGHGDQGCNFVMIQRSDPPRNTAEDTLVQAVGCHVTPGCLLKFKINDEEACFGF